MWNTTRSEERSNRRRSPSGSRQMRCIIVGTAYIQSAPCRSMSARHVEASNRGITTMWLPLSSASSDVVSGPLW